MPEVDRTAERDREDPMKSFMEVRGGPDNSQAGGQSDQCSFGICFEEVSCNRHYGPPLAGAKSGMGIQPSKRKYNRQSITDEEAALAQMWTLWQFVTPFIRQEMAAARP